MLRSRRMRGLSGAVGHYGLSSAILVAVLAAGGCSADLARFDFSDAGYGSNSANAPVPSAPVRRNAGIPVDQDAGYDRQASGGYSGGYDASRGYDARSYGSASGGSATYDRGYGSQSAYDPRQGPASPYNNGSRTYDNAQRPYSEPRGGYAPQPTYGGGQAPQRPYDSSAARGPAETRMASLPPAARPDTGARVPSLSDSTGRDTQPQAYAPAREPRQPAPVRHEPQSSRAPMSADAIEVQPGDTLSSISKRYRVSVSELMTLNSLHSPILKPGQRLILPRGRRQLVERSRPTPQAQQQARTAPEPAARVAEPVTPITTAARTQDAATHVVAPGESLYGIARKYNVKVAELQSANGIADVTKIRPGTALTIPGAATKTAAATRVASAHKPEARSEPAEPQVRTVTPITVKPRIINSETSSQSEPQRVASLGAGAPTASDASHSAGTQTARAEPVGGLPEPPKLAATGKFRWPVKGKVIAAFGPRPDKSHNDGINISVPQGTEVLASENGVVAYAGNELKGYGNLILLRHEGNWVSAYAHNDELLVRRGDKVQRGQPIAKAGNTGSVDAPQLHFELRQGSKPIDPVPHLEKQ